MGARARRHLAINWLAATEETSQIAAFSVWRRGSKVHLVRVAQLLSRIRRGSRRLVGLHGQEADLGETRTKMRDGRTLLPIAFACAVWPAGTAQAGDMVAGFDNIVCTGTFSYSFDSVDSACADSDIKAYQLESEGFDTCHICDDDSVPPGPGVVLLPCPRGQHGHGWSCHTDHVCRDDEIGGGSEDCKSCPPGTDANEAGTDCVPNGDYQVGRCTRPVQLPSGAAHLLPHHANAAVKKYWAGRYDAELGFFAHDWNEAIANAALAKGVFVPRTG